MRNIKRPHQSGLLISKKFLAKFNLTDLVVAHVEIIRSDPSFALKQIRKGKRIIVWTVNDENDLKLCQDLGVYAVITDYPTRALRQQT